MTCLQSTFKAHQSTQQRIVAAVGFIAMFTAQQGIQLVIRVECLVTGKDHLHSATPHSRAGDLHQTSCHARTMLRKVVETLQKLSFPCRALNRLRFRHPISTA